MMAMQAEKSQTLGLGNTGPDLPAEPGLAQQRPTSPRTAQGCCLVLPDSLLNKDSQRQALALSSQFPATCQFANIKQSMLLSPQSDSDYTNKLSS